MNSCSSLKDEICYMYLVTLTVCVLIQMWIQMQVQHMMVQCKPLKSGEKSFVRPLWPLVQQLIVIFIIDYSASYFLSCCFRIVVCSQHESSYVLSEAFSVFHWHFFLEWNINCHHAEGGVYYLEHQNHTSGINLTIVVATYSCYNGMILDICISCNCI